MKCLALVRDDKTKQLRRCKNPQRFVFCPTHMKRHGAVAFSTLALLGSIATLVTTWLFFWGRPDPTLAHLIESTTHQSLTISAEQHAAHVRAEVESVTGRPLDDDWLDNAARRASTPFEQGVVALVDQRIPDAIEHLQRAAESETAGGNAEAEGRRALALQMLARAYAFDGRHRKALDTLERALVLTGSDRQIRYDRAWELMEVGRLGEAERELRKLVEADQLVGSTENDLALDIRESLGVIQARRGDFRGARATLEEVLSIREQQSGGRRATVIVGILSNLANVHHFLGNHADSIRLFEEALALGTDLVGEADPRVQAIHHNLIRVLESTGRAAEALERQRGVVAGMRTSLSPEHPFVFEAEEGVASLLSALGRHDESRRIHERLLERRTAILGESAPNTLDSKSDLASELFRLGETEQAQELQEEVYTAWLPTPWHPGAFRAVDALASTLIQSGNVERAHTILAKAFSTATAELGADSQVALGLGFTLASARRQLGMLEPALALYDDMVPTYQREYGPDNPRTMTLLANRANILAQLGRRGEAIEIQREILGFDHCHYGDDHPATRIDAWNLFENLDLEGKEELANGIGERFLCGLVETEPAALSHTDRQIREGIAERCGEIGTGTWPQPALPTTACQPPEEGIAASA